MIKRAAASVPFFFLLLHGISAEEPVHTDITIRSEVEWVQPGVPFLVGVRMKMDPGWHTYWENPGDSGGPIQQNWDLPPGFQIELKPHPTPDRIDTPPLVTFGYADEVVLLSEIRSSPTIPAKSDVAFRLHIKWLECADICIPREKRAVLVLPVKNNPPVSGAATAPFFSEAKSRLPLPSDEWAVTAKDDGRFVRLVLEKPEWASPHRGRLYFFPRQRGVFDYSAAQSTRFTDHRIVQDIPKSDLSTASVSQLNGILRAEDGWRGPGSEQGLSIAVPVEKGKGVSRSILIILVFAFLGGVILNGMPCVLPVLSLKVLGFIKERDSDPGGLKRHGHFYTIGIVVAFWILAGIIVGIRSAGQELGWGFQLQNPVFITFLAFLFTLLALNFFGVFEIGTSLLAFGNRASAGPAASRKNLEALSTGVLATIVATPCTAPFMGVAMGYALSQPVHVTFLVFTMLGLGLAAPYLLLCYRPGAVKWLPKPGAWMNTIKKFFGFVLLATVIWLLWVLGLQTSETQIIRVLTGLLAAGLAAWIYATGTDPSMSKRARFVLMGLAIFITAASFWWAIRAAAVSGKADSTLRWEPFSKELVNKMRNDDRLVFVDFTAAWCLTCQVNERVVFSNETVLDRIKKENVAMIKADWTNRDDRITAELKKHRRSGVPFYPLYPGQQDPLILPELLTPKIFLEKLNEANERRRTR